MARIGIFSLTECLLFNLCLIVQHFRSSGIALTLGIWVFRSGLLLLQISLFIGGTSDAFLISLLDLTLSASIFYHIIQLVLQSTTMRFSSTSVLPFIFMAMQGISFTSNSFIIYESDVTRFALQTLLLVVFMNLVRTSKWGRWSPNFVSLRNRTNSVLTYAFRPPKKATHRYTWKKFLSDACAFLPYMLVVRLGKMFERCREEQILCEPMFFSLPLSAMPYGIVIFY